ncbi:glycosyltransferase family 1 protein [Lentithecium fluviatile CBS 122367]|uniref:Glycosyltransferase family 1 protein n=1 Tax=Lentithecium fluviatile CBS 122367 TaxID=1168545 RepID=A0A6G1IHD7_9PLEO|nr:glycosyltransferase family 1 protein [Lentithecium fluviatile CBS 122367]
MGKPPHQGPDAKEVHAKANADVLKQNMELGTLDYWWAKFKELGVLRDTYPQMYQALYSLPDYLLTLGVPKFEFPRSDLRLNVRYFGAYKKVGNQDDKVSELPSWWDDIAKAKNEGQKVVLVSQGTIEARPEELTLPTLEALKNRDDVLVDIMVSNGGYGAVQHCMRLGVPLVVAGEGQDKSITNAIIEFKGVGINLGTRQPVPEKIEAAVDRILTDESFKITAQKMSVEYEKYDVGKVFDGVMKDVVRDFQKRKRSNA